jgi:hypothetical protein
MAVLSISLTQSGWEWYHKSSIEPNFYVEATSDDHRHWRFLDQLNKACSNPSESPSDPADLEGYSVQVKLLLQQILGYHHSVGTQWKHYAEQLFMLEGKTENWYQAIQQVLAHAAEISFFSDFIQFKRMLIELRNARWILVQAKLPEANTNFKR